MLFVATAKLGVGRGARFAEFWAIAQRFYDKASLYPRIFEANTDILSSPDLIKVGQKLKIPKI